MDSNGENMLVILDSSMLMIPLERKINITSELERILTFSYNLVVPEVVIVELERLVETASPAIKRKSKLALELAENFEKISSVVGIKADDEILRLAQEMKAIVATNDSALRRKLLKKGISVISLHGKNKLRLFGVPTS